MCRVRLARLELLEGTAMNDRSDCGECGQNVATGEYHPYLFCALYKAGIRNQAKALNDYGWFFRDAPK